MQQDPELDNRKEVYTVYDNLLLGLYDLLEEQ